MSLLVAVPNHFVQVVFGLFGHVYSHLSWLSCPKNPTMSLLVAVPNHFVRVVSGLFGHVYSQLSWLSCPINFLLPCIMC